MVDPILHGTMQGHDALFDGLDFDPVRGTVSLRIHAYPDFGASERIEGIILFEQTKAVAMHADVVSLADNRFAGTVSQWRLAEKPGTSYIYLSEGYIAITADAAPKLVQP